MNFKKSFIRIALAVGLIGLAACSESDSSGGSRLKNSTLETAAIWTSQTSPAFGEWMSVVYGNGLFVAVSSDGVMTSPDGISWTLQTPSTNQRWISVAYGNGLFVAVSSDDVMTSPDGITWTSKLMKRFFDRLELAAVTYGNGLFVAVSDRNRTSGGRVITSSDGINWTLQTSVPDRQWSSVTYGNGLFVAVCDRSCDESVMTSPDGINWTLQTSASEDLWRSVTYGNGMFVAVGRHDVMTSLDGITWTLETLDQELRQISELMSVVYGNGLFVAVSSDGVMTSPDGISWTLQTSAVNNHWSSVTYGNGMFVAVSRDGTGNRVMTSGQAVVPNVTGMTCQDASQILKDAIFIVALEPTDTACDLDNKVSSQIPAPGDRAITGDSVTLVFPEKPAAFVDSTTAQSGETTDSSTASTATTVDAEVTTTVAPVADDTAKAAIVDATATEVQLPATDVEVAVDLTELLKGFSVAASDVSTVEYQVAGGTWVTLAKGDALKIPKSASKLSLRVIKKNGEKVVSEKALVHAEASTDTTMAPADTTAASDTSTMAPAESTAPVTTEAPASSDSSSSNNTALYILGFAIVAGAVVMILKKKSASAPK